MKRSIAILGSTGSIGEATLDVIKRLGEFEVIALSAKEGVDTLNLQIQQFSPKYVAIQSKDKAKDIKGKVKVFAGEDSIGELLQSIGIVDVIVVAISGCESFLPTIHAASHCRRLAVASKEAIVVGGEVLTKKLNEQGVDFIPIDSEHSAIFQCTRNECAIERIWLTCSGGPLLHPRDGVITPEVVLKHPRWRMGKKISIDSATLMNKGFEVIEAHQLFSVAYENIKVIIHEEAFIHSLVEFKDGTYKAQLCVPDMRIPIAYALTYPERKDLELPRLDLYKVGSLTFQEPDLKRFPCLEYAYIAGNIGGCAPAVLAQADEVAVNAFLGNEISFELIPLIIKEVLSYYKPTEASVDTLLETLAWAKLKAEDILESLKR